MKLTKKQEYGLLLFFYLLRSGRSNLAYVAEGLGLSLNFLQQVARSLKLMHIISSKKGPGGGYFISEESKATTTVLDVLLALGELMSEDAMTLNAPAEIRTLAKMHRRFSGVIFDLLKSETMAEVADRFVRDEVLLMDSVGKDQDATQH